MKEHRTFVFRTVMFCSVLRTQNRTLHENFGQNTEQNNTTIFFKVTEGRLGVAHSVQPVYIKMTVNNLVFQTNEFILGVIADSYQFIS